MRRSFSLFVKEAWKIIEPATPLIWNWHLDVICDHVQALMEGRLGKQNLIINVPPGSMKSTIVSICLVPWMWTWKPWYRAAFASGVPGIESRDSGKCRIILESDWYRDTFDIQWKFSRDQNEKLYYRNTRTGERLATTTGAGVTGHRFMGLFVDDALDARKAFQQTEVDKVNQWWDQAFYNRIADEKTSTRCIIGQRLREDDLPGHLLERDGLARWEIVKIPQQWEQAEEDTRHVTGLGWTDPRRVYTVLDDAGAVARVDFTVVTRGKEVAAPDGLMFRERFPADSIASAALVLGQSGFEGQHQQRPSMLQGEIFTKGHASFIHRSQIPVGTIVQRMLSIDSAIKEKEENDYSVILEGWEFDRGIFINSCMHEKWRYTQLREQVTLKTLEVNPAALLIEDKASGQNLIQEYQNDGKFPVVPIMPLVDKQARARPLTPYWEANRVFFPLGEDGQPEPWVAIFLKELYNFPKAKHDDMVDAFTQMLQYLFLRPGAKGLLEYYNVGKREDEAKKAKEDAEDAHHHVHTTVYLNGAKPA
jgi:predicted phage terminase large subunit-like protein